MQDVKKCYGTTLRSCVQAESDILQTIQIKIDCIVYYTTC